jgi:hypothetical protein
LFEKTPDPVVSFEQFAAAMRKIGLYWLPLNQPPKMDG